MVSQGSWIAPRVRYLPRAPIVEAILDFRFGTVANDDIEALMPATLPFSQTLPHVSVRNQIDQNDKAVFLSNKSVPRSEIIISDEDGLVKSNKSIAIQLDGFVIRQAKPYTSWNDLRDAANVLFEGLVPLASPQSVVRLATRYTNKIDLPDRKFDFDEFFLYGPKVPNIVSQKLFDFNSSVGIQDDKDNSMKAWFTQYLNFDPRGKISVIIDIDVFRTEPLSPRWSDLETHLEAMHIMKNSLFFGSLTEEALRRYE